MALLPVALGLASGAAFAFVGARLLARDVPGEHRPAARAFAAGWLAAAVSAWSTAATAGGALPPMVAAWTSLVCGAILLGGTVAYLAYLVTGHRLAVHVSAAVYVALLSASVATVLALAPQGTITTGLATRFDFGPAGRAYAGWLSILLFTPAIVASASYLALYAVATTPTARWRITLVGGGLALWSSLALLGRITEDPALVAPLRAAAALLAAAVLLAYAPPAWATRRWGVQAIRAELPAARLAPALRAEREAQLGARVRELI